MIDKIRNWSLAPVMALSMSSLFWAGNFAVGRALREVTEAVPLNYWRWFIATIILLPFSIGPVRRSFPLIRKHWKLLLTLSMTGVVAFHVSVYHALRTTTAMNALLFQSFCPVMIIFGSRLLYRERINNLQLAGIIISMLGVVVLLTHGQPERLIQLQFNSGDLWMLVAIILWSAYSVLLKIMPEGISQTALLATIAVCGVIIMTPIYLITGSGALGIDPSFPVLAGLLYIGLFASALAYFFWNYGVSQLGPNRAGSYLHLMPLFGAVLSISFLGEYLLAYHVAGAVFIAVGILLTHRTVKETNAHG